MRNPFGLPIDLPGSRAVRVVGDVLASQDRFVAAVDQIPEVDVRRTSGLGEWTVAELLAHVSYGAAAARRVSVAALSGGTTQFYPGGAEQRARSIQRGRSMTTNDLRRELSSGHARLGQLWRRFTEVEWDAALGDERFPGATVARHLMLRWTEVEVHRSDLLGVSDWRTWSPVFIRHGLPLRVAWQPLARRLPTAALELNGRWALHDTDSEIRWVIHAEGADVHVGREPAPADVEITGPAGALLALLLGRPTGEALNVVGDTRLAASYKQAFPGP
jgi:uncharacterized protein (TIGR03083 family)